MNTSEKFWNRVASKPGTKVSRVTSKTIELTRKHLHSNNVVLDFGCGTGSITTAIANDVQHIHAIDTSAGMIEIAKEVLEERVIHNITYSQSTLFDKRLEQGAFDVAVAFNILHYIEALPQVIQRSCL